jgi:hypothetical protein
VEHAFALEAVHDLPQFAGQAWIVLGGQLEPLRDGAHARIRRRLGDRADVEQARDNRLADCQEVDARVDEGVVQVENDDRFQTAQGKRVAPNQWLVQ